MVQVLNIYFIMVPFAWKQIVGMEGQESVFGQLLRRAGGGIGMKIKLYSLPPLLLQIKLFFYQLFLHNSPI